MLVGFKTNPAGTECALPAQLMTIPAALNSIRIATHVITAKVAWLRSEQGQRE
jgi:hypothetical protein